MKKILFVAAVSAAIFAGCAQNDVIDSSVAGQLNQGTIGFQSIFPNSVKGTQRAEVAGHYEFGVFAFKEAGDNAPIMNNYLVAWGKNGYYAELNHGTTYGDFESQVDGQSGWFYEGLTPDYGTAYTHAENVQALKYWDESKENHYFYAYAPFSPAKDAKPEINPNKIGYNAATFTFNDLSSFYTTPEANAASGLHQTANADVRAASTTSSSDKYNGEVLNYNEALYAYNTVAKADYGKDVPFTFNHVNAKITVAFYEEIPGYKVQLTNMIPEVIPATPGRDAVAKQNGIVLTPAKKEQVTAIAQAPEDKLPRYHETAATVTVNTTSDVISVNGADTVNNNLYFQENNTVPYNSSKVIGETSTAKSVSPTWLYVLPNHDGSAYITDAKSAAETGYTLHVSYILIPEDGTTSTQIYDARVWIPAEACQWQAGKAYTYVFKITRTSNGSSDPKKLDPDPAKQEDGNKEYWADPRDPRVDEDPAMNPIVFDGIEIVDYENATITPAENVITENTLYTAFTAAWTNATPVSGAKKYAFSALTNYNTLTLNGITAADFVPETADVNNCDFTMDLVNLFRQTSLKDNVKKIIIDGKEYVWTENAVSYPDDPEVYADGFFNAEPYWIPAFDIASKVSQAFIGGATEAKVVVTFADDTKQYDVTLVYNGTPFTKFDVVWMGTVAKNLPGAPTFSAGTFEVYSNPNANKIILDGIVAEDLEMYEAPENDKNNVITDLRTALFALDHNFVGPIQYGGYTFTWTPGDAEGNGNWTCGDIEPYAPKLCALQSVIAANVASGGNIEQEVEIKVSYDGISYPVKLQLTKANPF